MKKVLIMFENGFYITDKSVSNASFIITDLIILLINKQIVKNLFDQNNLILIIKLFILSFCYVFKFFLTFLNSYEFITLLLSIL